MLGFYFTRSIRPISLCLLAVLVASCGTSPKGKYLKYTGDNLKQNEGVIHICRTSSLVGAMGGIDVFINNEIVANIANGSVVEVVKSAGMQVVIFRLGNGSQFGVKVNLNPEGHSYVLQTASLNSLKVLPFGLVGTNMGWQSLVVDKSTFEGNCSTYSTLKIQMP